MRRRPIPAGPRLDHYYLAGAAFANRERGLAFLVSETGNAYGWRDSFYGSARRKRGARRACVACSKA